MTLVAETYLKKFTMSRKSAANFSAANTQPYHRYTVPKSRSEIFVDYMKSTGYELPRNVTPSHYDFLFQDKELSDCVKFLMEKVKRSVGEEDLKRYEQLLNNGVPLTKTELDTAEAHERKILLEIETSREEVAQEMDALNSEIEETRYRINQWNQVKSSYQRSVELHKTQDVTNRHQHDTWKRKLQLLRQEYQEKRELMGNEIQLTQETLTRVLNTVKPAHQSSDYKSEKNHLNFQFNCISIHNEDKFFSLLSNSAENYGTGLVGKSEVFDPFEAENFARECAANVTDIERLRTVILYEYERKFRLTLGLQKYSYIADCLPSLIDTAKRIASQPRQIQDRLIQEYQKRTQDLVTKKKALKQFKLKELLEAKLSELNGQIQGVQDLKARAKAKENLYFGVISKMLLNQRARLKIGMHLMKKSGERISEDIQYVNLFLRQLQYFQQLDSSLNSPSVPILNPLLHLALTRNNIPTRVMSSYESSWNALGLIGQATEIESIRRNISNEQKVVDRKKQIRDEFEASKKNWVSLKSEFSNAEVDQSGTELNVIINRNQAIKTELDAYLVNRKRLTQQAIDCKQSKIGDINAFLESLTKLL